MIDLIKYLYSDGTLTVLQQTFVLSVGILVVDSLLSAVFKSLFRR